MHAYDGTLWCRKDAPIERTHIGSFQLVVELNGVGVVRHAGIRGLVDVHGEEVGLHHDKPRSNGAVVALREVGLQIFVHVAGKAGVKFERECMMAQRRCPLDIIIDRSIFVCASWLATYNWKVYVEIFCKSATVTVVDCVEKFTLDTHRAE